MSDEFSKPPPFTDFGKWLGFHLAKDWRKMLDCPIAFLAVISFTIFLAWLLVWKVVVPEKNEQLASKQAIIERKQSDIDSLSKQLESFRQEDHKITETSKQGVLQTPPQCYLKIESVEQILNENVNMPSWGAYRLVATVDGQKYSFPTTQPFVTGSINDSIPIPYRDGMHNVSFERQDFNQLRASRSNTNGFVTQQGIVDTPKLNNLTTNGLIIQKLTGEVVGVTKVVYKLSQ
jgi:hypothetical protein